jgi:hypothetical protein
MKTLKAKILFVRQEEAYPIIKARFYSFSEWKWDLPKGGIEKERAEDTA